MVRKTIALAVAAMVGLSGQALAADAKASASKVAVVKASNIQRASLPKGADQAMGGPNSDELVFIGFGLLTLGVTFAAFHNDNKPSSP